MAITTTDIRYPAISPKAYEHPADRAATAALGSIPLLDRVLKRLSELRIERAFQQLLLADAVELSERQLPAVYAAHVGVARALDLPAVPGLYLAAAPGVTNAATVGSSKPVVIITSGIANLPDDARRTVLAHEAGHVLSDHVHYGTVLQILQRLLASGLAPVARLPLQAVALVLLEWYRCAELSGDRAATLVNEDPMVSCRLLMNLAGGSVEGLDVNAFIAQAEAFAETEDLFARPGRWLTELTRTHPFTVRRVAELTRWVREGDYDRIRDGSYLRRGEEPPPSEQMKAATEHYRQRFTEIVDRVAGGVQRLAGQVSQWLRGEGGDGDLG